MLNLSQGPVRQICVLVVALLFHWTVRSSFKFCDVFLSRSQLGFQLRPNIPNRVFVRRFLECFGLYCLIIYRVKLTIHLMKRYFNVSPRSSRVIVTNGILILHTILVSNLSILSSVVRWT